MELSSVIIELDFRSLKFNKIYHKAASQNLTRGKYKHRRSCTEEGHQKYQGHKTSISSISSTKCVKTYKCWGERSTFYQSCRRIDIC